MLLHPLLSAVDRARKALDQLRILFNKALFGEICRIRHAAARLADRCDDIAAPFRLEHGGRGLKQRDIVARAVGKRAGHEVELDAVVKRQVLFRVEPVLTQYVFQRHVRHAAAAPGQDMLALQLFPGKIRLRLAPDEERPVALRHLREDLGVVLLALVVDVDRRLRPREADVDIVRQHRRHDLIRAAAV